MRIFFGEMRATIFITLSTIFAVLLVHGQTVSTNNVPVEALALKGIDSAHYRIYYRMYLVRDTLDYTKKTEAQTVLFVGKKLSAFLDYYQFRSDSLYNELAAAHKNSTEVLSAILPLQRIANFKLHIAKNYPTKNEFTFQQKFGSLGIFQYLDKGVRLDWKLEGGVQTIKGYECKKATCHYRGRDYIAWYAPEIPLTDGPYVFTGLPGLIIKIDDTKNQVGFTLNGFKKLDSKEKIYIKEEEVRNVSREEMRKTERNLATSPAAMLQLLSGKVSTETENSARRLPERPYNPIELE